MRVPEAIKDAAGRFRDAAARVRDLPIYISGRHALLGLGAIVLAAVVVWAIASGPLGGEDDSGAGSRVVTFAAEGNDPGQVGTLGFPVVATRNTTRISGGDPTTDAAAAALATHPASAAPLEAAVLVNSEDWQSGIAASVLSGPPLRAPILLGQADGLPQPTIDALDFLKPRGGGPADAAVIRVGDVAAPSGLASTTVEGDGPAELADGIDRLRGRLTRADPAHLIVVSEDEPAYAMPAAAWAARSGDPVLFSGRDDVPEATLATLRRHRGTPVYVLGPRSVVSEEAIRKLKRASAAVRRIGAERPVANAIAFARYADASFGWNINDPGHGMVIANVSRPLDAAASAGLSSSGAWGPLLLVESPAPLPAELREFLLDVKPGYVEDPTRAVYNHLWLMGDTTTVSATMQAEIDELAELAQVSGGGPTDSLALPGGPDEESQPAGGGKQKP
ncbi:MAG: hypothetical protein EXQ70_10475 [Solirubrobacterales bacterium]|nr:hypothetical protein [Solirubrobacterales bacterium]